MLPYKSSIELCSFEQGSLSQCNNGNNNIPTNITGKYISKIEVKSGVIKLTGDKSLSALNITLTPSIPANSMPFKWSVLCESKTDANLKSLCEKTFVF